MKRVTFTFTTEFDLNTPDALCLARTKALLTAQTEFAAGNFEIEEFEDLNSVLLGMMTPEEVALFNQ